MHATCPEHILLHFLRFRSSLHTLRQATAASADCWQQLLRAGAKHGLSPLLYDRVKQRAAEGLPVPPGVLDSLRVAYLMNGTKNSLLYHDLNIVLGALSQTGIPCLVLKGAHLAQWVYETPALRTIGDLDLLVQKSQVVGIVAILKSLGYRCTDERLQVEKLLGDQGQYHLPPFFKHPGPRLEIHWRLTDRPLDDFVAQAWTAGRMTNLGGTKTLVLSPEHNLLYLCLHIRQHGFAQGLRPIYDVAILLRQHYLHLRWDEFVRQSRTQSAAHCVFIVLLLVQELFDAPVPFSTLLDLYQDDFSEARLDQAIGLIIEGEQGAGTFHSILHSWNAFVQGWRSAPFVGKMGMLRRRIFPSQQYMSQYMLQVHVLPLTPVRRYSCYLTRLCDLLAKGVCLGWHALSDKQTSSAIAGQVREQVLLKHWLNQEALEYLPVLPDVGRMRCEHHRQST